ncbi:MAG: lipocalin family protein [Phycisphaerae bacterium]
MKNIMCLIFSVLTLVIVILASSCGRDAPPVISDFVPPLKLADVESTVPDVAPQPSKAPPLAPPPMPKPVKSVRQVVQTPVQEIKPEPKPQAPAAPSIVGTWQITEMIQNGTSMPLPPGMQMTLTFDDGGTVTMSVSAPQMPQSQTQQGTYTLNNDQITMNIKNEAMTGTCTFEGNTKVTLDFTKVKMVLVRS